MGNIKCSQILVEMWINFDARVRQICQFYGITKQELASNIGTAQSNLSNLNSGRHHTEAYRILITYPEISARWLLFGDGEMLTQKEAGDNPQPQQNRQTDQLPEGVTMIGDETSLYKYMYEKVEAKLEAKEKELVAATKEYVAAITRLQIENEHLRQQRVPSYGNGNDNGIMKAAEHTDSNN